MQVSSHTTNDDSQDDDEFMHHKPMRRHIRNHNEHYQRSKLLNNQSSSNNHRSITSTFRHSIRHLTSCASVRRKPGHNSASNKHTSSIAENNSVQENEYLPASKSLFIQKKSSSTHKHMNRLAELTTHSANNRDIPPALPPRKPMDKKNSVPMPSTSRNSSAADNNTLQISTTSTNDDTSSSSSLAPPRILPNKEISTSLVNLMGTASESITVNSGTPTTFQDIQPRRYSLFGFLQRIATAPATTVDRLGILESLSNAGTASTFESPSSNRTVITGNQATMTYTKPANDYTWCHETTHLDNEINKDECIPQLEVDDKPLTYRQHFENKEHFNWYGISQIYGPVIISYKHSTDQNRQRSIMSIVRTRQRTSVEFISNIQLSSTPVDVLRRICEQCNIHDIEYFDPVLCEGVHELLLKYDESHVSYQHKFGIIYQRESQLTEEDIFSNEMHSNTMEQFLNVIGKRVKLKDFRGFRGGLDVKADQTGTESVYEQFRNHEIMFHVSTLLPYSKSERQQLERKRHIGNDIVAIIFQEKETKFDPECIASQFLHVYLVITPLDSDCTQFKISVIRRDSVPSFGPVHHCSTPFSFDHRFKEWLLTKLINAEMASCRSSIFQKHQERTKMNLFENLYQTLHDNNRPLMNFVLFNSQYKHECDIEQQQKEEIQNNIPVKTSDNSLLGSVRRRFIAPKSRTQNSTAHDHGKSTPTTNHTNESRSKTRSMTMDLKRSASRESITTNGNNLTKMTSLFSSSKTSSPRSDKSVINRSINDHEHIDSFPSARSTTKMFTPSTCPSSPWASTPINGCLTSSTSDWNHNNGDCYVHETPILNIPLNFNNKLSSDHLDHDIQLPYSQNDLQSTSKDDLIKVVLTLQQQLLTRKIHLDQNHSNDLKHHEIQYVQQNNLITRDSP